MKRYTVEQRSLETWVKPTMFWHHINYTDLFPRFNANTRLEYYMTEQKIEILYGTPFASFTQSTTRDLDRS
jgi:hypothetical protein